jgi:hypothetical protein
MRAQSQSTSTFPESIYWVNCEYNLSPSTFSDKLVVVLFFDIASADGIYQMLKLQDLAIKNPQIQLIQIVKGNSEHKVTLSELTDFIQEHNLVFPFGVAPALSPFVNDASPVRPTLYIYDKSSESSEVLYTTSEFNSFYERIRKYEGVRNGMPGYGLWQMRSTILPSYYANPLIELPGAMAIDEASSTMFIAENSQFKISRYSGTGELKDFLGAVERGDKDSNLGGAKISFVTGMAYDPSSDLLFMADLGNQKIKAVDYNSKLCFTYLGSGIAGDKRIDSIASPLEVDLNFPVDVMVKDKKLYVLCAAPAQVLRLDIKTGKLESETALAGDKAVNGMPLKMAKGEEGILILTNEGNIYELNYDEKTGGIEKRYSQSNWFDLPGDVAEKKGELYITMPRRHVVVKYAKGKEKIIAGTNNAQGYLNSKKSAEVKFFQPSEMVLTGNRLLIGDRRNHMIRMVSIENGATSSIVPEYSFDFFTNGDAINSGEGVYFESEEIFGEGVNEVLISWDISEYEFVTDGYNHVGLEGSQGVTLADEGLSESGIRILVDTKKSEPFFQCELYLTLRLKENPDIIVLKKAHLNFSFTVIPGEELKHEIEYRPNLLH